MVARPLGTQHNKQRTATHAENQDESQKHCAKEKKPDAEVGTHSHASTYLRFQLGRLTLTESRPSVACQGVEGLTAGGTVGNEL